MTTESTETDQPLVDVRDMIVVHTALLREFRLAPADVMRAPSSDRGQVHAVAAHLELICTLLHHHHAGEDELLWPKLLKRAPASAAPDIEHAERQHEGLDGALDEVNGLRLRWVEAPDERLSARLADSLTILYTRLAEHLEHEERALLPLAAGLLREQEWKAIGEAGAASVPKSALMLVFGMFAYEGDPAVLADMLREAPAPVRFLVPRIAPRVYARRARRIHGTSQP